MVLTHMSDIFTASRIKFGYDQSLRGIFPQFEAIAANPSPSLIGQGTALVLPFLTHGQQRLEMRTIFPVYFRLKEHMEAPC